MYFWCLCQSGLVFLAPTGEMLREAPAQHPKPSSCAGSVPWEQTAQALTCLRDFCYCLTLHKVTGPSTGEGSWIRNNTARQCNVLIGVWRGWRERRLLGCEAIFQTGEKSFIFFFFSCILEQPPFIRVWKELIIKEIPSPYKDWSEATAGPQNMQGQLEFTQLTALISQSRTLERGVDPSPFHVTMPV